jgi:nitroimidazol reductase NimA-like FMN-containing flavoprotein (pyridoxamine 5'-phosphate oxidase superfamily)
MPPETIHLAEISREECLRLLGGASLGRVGVSVDALPAIFPVFIALVDDVVVFRTVPGTKLITASGGTIIALEADGFDPATGEGWSVLVRGRARPLDDEARAQRARSSLTGKWHYGAAEHLVEVHTDLVTGRRIF